MHIYMYDPRHDFCVGLDRSPEDRFAHDAAHFFTICATFLYNGKGFRINTTFVVIYMYDPRHEFCVGLGRSPGDRFAHDAARFFTICARFLYKNKYHICCDIERCYGVSFFDVLRHRIDTNQSVHIS